MPRGRQEDAKGDSGGRQGGVKGVGVSKGCQGSRGRQEPEGVKRAIRRQEHARRGSGAWGGQDSLQRVQGGAKGASSPLSKASDTLHKASRAGDTLSKVSKAGDSLNSCK